MSDYATIASRRNCYGEWLVYLKDSSGRILDICYETSKEDALGTCRAINKSVKERGTKK